MEAVLSPPPPALGLPSQAVRPETPLDFATWQGLWIVAECRPQHTFTAEDQIAAQGIQTYVPSYHVKHRYPSKCVIRPLFPGYVFCCLPTEMYKYAVRCAFGVYDLIDVRDQRRLVKELGDLKAYLAAEPNYVQVRCGLMKGDAVRVKSGPFVGQEGVIANVDGVDRFVLNLHTLGRSCPTEIDADLLEPV